MLSLTLAIAGITGFLFKLIKYGFELRMKNTTETDFQLISDQMDIIEHNNEHDESNSKVIHEALDLEFVDNIESKLTVDLPPPGDYPFNSNYLNEFGYNKTPNRCLEYKNVIINYNCHTLCLNWTLENINKENVHLSRHRHCEFLLIDSTATKDVPNEWLLAFLPKPEGFDESQDCYFCQQSSVWETFYRYFQFLTDRYDEILVFSGGLVSPEVDKLQYLCTNDEMVPYVTHYFKAIFCHHPDGSRLECYKFKVGCCQCQDLNKFIITKDVLEFESQYSVFGQFDSMSITHTTTHPDF